MTNRIIILFLMLTTGCIALSAQPKGSFTDSRDGHSYESIQIGSQVWMAENLAWLPSVFPVNDSQFDLPCYYVYGYNGRETTEARKTAVYARYGALYNFTAAGSACPDGWHLPSDEEWGMLEEHLGMVKTDLKGREWRVSGNTGKKVKAESGWKNGSGTDETGLSLIPGGCRGYGGFESEGFCGYYWTASPAGGDNGWRRGFCGDDDGSCRQEDRRYFGCSVRCIRDKPAE